MSVRAIECIEIDPAKWSAFRHIHNWTLEDVGRFTADLSARALMGDADWVCSLPFVDRIIWESPSKSPRSQIHPALRAKVLAVGQCAYCGAAEDLSVDHIIPISKGGSDEEANLQCLCLPCNLRKGNR